MSEASREGTDDKAPNLFFVENFDGVLMRWQEVYSLPFGSYASLGNEFLALFANEKYNRF